MSIAHTWPSTPDFQTRSEPAKSTRLSFDFRIVSSPALRATMWAVKIQCDRELAMFIGVELIIRFVSPINNKFNASSSLLSKQKKES
jgi:hypothetical protein